jgi:DNA-binding MarR family transcriptional regulator
MKKKLHQADQPSPHAMQSWLSVVRSYHLCEAVMSQRLAALGLKLAEHEVLVNLLRTPGSTQQALAQRCFVAKSGISMLVTRMVQARWVLRQPDEVDARAWRLFLTGKGERLAMQAQAVQTEVVNAMSRDCSEAELQAITRAMAQTSDVLQTLLATPGKAEA